MKRIRAFLTLILLLILASCNQDGSIYNVNKIRVSIIDSNFFTASLNTSLINYNTDFETTLFMRDDYVVESCSYFNYEISKIDKNKYKIIFKGINKPTRIKINAHRKDGFNTLNEVINTSIKYYYNDGSDKYKLENYQLSYHIRQNTWAPTDLKRDGYTLNGWNTSADLKGEHIGLGSRVTVYNNQSLTLYAEWVKWSDSTNFLYQRNNDNTISLSGYKGNGKGEYLCLPEYIDNYKVTKVLSSFTTNILCGKINIDTLIIPNTFEYIEDYAFKNSEFKNIYFSDNLAFSSYKSFNYNINHYFINAYQKPRLQKNNYNVRFADNIDLLIKYQNKKKIVLYGGCNFAYGIYSPMIENEFNDYRVINCGLNGEFNSLFQIEIIRKYLDKDDIFIHSPEQMNGYQFMTMLLVDSRLFAMVEGNYDLLAIADFSYSPFIIEAYTDYNELRLKNDECEYQDYPGFFNTYGDYLEDRDFFEGNEKNRDISYTEGWKYDFNLLKDDNIALLGRTYDEIAKMGVNVYFTHSPMNENINDDNVYQTASRFQALLKKALSKYNVLIISEITDYIFKGRYFFDTDYHLNYYGAEIRTERLINDLKRVGVI